jgi:signal transduction histidine kinase
MQLRQLRTELREHYDLLRHQRDDLMRVQLQKERLMSFIVHDLKNPVNAMDLHAQVLLRSKDLSERARASVTQIRGEARQLTRLILNLLDLGKADEGKLTPKRDAVDVRALIEDVLSELSLAAKSKEIELAQRVDAAELDGDADLLQRMLANLVENAIRHSPEGTHVTVSVDAEAASVVFRVSDEGNGLAPELRERIFDAFVQLDAASGSATRGGRGLGLAFCKLVAEAHGGSIQVEDSAKGATFAVRLPK